MRKLALIAAFLLAIFVGGIADTPSWYGFLPGVSAYAQAGTAGATTAVACGAASTQLLASADLGTGTVRHFLMICNNGPGVGYVAFGTSNAATVTNGIPLGPMDCLPGMPPVIGPWGVATLPSNLDVACINDSAAVANMVALDW